jgi:CDP-glycerol glycerophosphotransferase (TagB/SpsB family)
LLLKDFPLSLLPKEKEKKKIFSFAPTYKKNKFFSTSNKKKKFSTDPFFSLPVKEKKKKNPSKIFFLEEV